MRRAVALEAADRFAPALAYGDPRMLQAFRLPAATRDRYTLLEALPQMRGSRAFDAYVDV